MADDGMGMFGKEQPEIASLKEMLRAQQNLLQKLYNELEVERESSSTAASEALSMILRLQGEKAAVKMEAEQYKRMVEEKMCHAEESLSIFEDLMYHREMEVAALDYQVQAYRYKLISMGCADPGDGEIKFPENLLQRNEDFAGTPGGPGRRNSAPAQNFKLLNLKKGVSEREESTSYDRDWIQNTLEEREENEWGDQESDNGRRPAHSHSSMNDINSYFEQIRKLDERVKEVAGVHLRSATSSPIPLKYLSSGNSSDPMRLISMNESEHGESCTDIPDVMDVFEVPQVDLEKKSHGKIKAFADNDQLKQDDSIPDDALKPVKSDIEWLNNLLASVHEKKMSKPSQTLLDGHRAIVRPTARVAVCQPISIQQTTTSEIIEAGNHQASTEEPGGREEELILLSEIKEQLNSIQSEIRHMNTKQSVLKEEQAMVSYMETTFMEEMIQFWL